MRWQDVPFSPPTRTLRWFAALWLMFSAALGCHHWRQGPGPLAWASLALGGVGLVGLCKPPLLRPVFVGAMVLTFPIGWLTSHAVLAALYYGLLTPLGLTFRLIGRDNLGLRFEPETPSYWEEKPAVHHARRYFRQF